MAMARDCRRSWRLRAWRRCAESMTLSPHLRTRVRYGYGMAVEYREEPCRSALNRVKGMPFEWSLNPYRGCTHGCHYCYARRYQTQFELGSDDEFSTIILVKTNF